MSINTIFWRDMSVRRHPMGQLIRASLARGARLQLGGVLLQETPAIESERAECQKKRSAVAQAMARCGGEAGNPGGRLWPA